MKFSCSKLGTSFINVKKGIITQFYSQNVPGNHPILKRPTIFGAYQKHLLTHTAGHKLLEEPKYFFLLNLYLKHGISSVYVMVDFICKGYLEM